MQILETDIGEIELPDEFTPEQIQDFATNRLPTLRKGLSKGPIADMASRIPRDLAETGAAIVQGFTRGRQLMRDMGAMSAARQQGVAAAMTAPPEQIAAISKIAEETAQKARQLETREQRLQENPLYQFGEQTKEAAQEVFAVNPEYENTKRAALSRAAMSTIPVIAAAPTGPIGMAATYAALSGQQGAEEAIEAGHPDKADDAYLAYAGLGAISEAALGYPIALLRSVRAARRAGVKPEEFGKAFKTSLADQGKKIGAEILKASGREAVQESTEQAGQNVAARMIGYDPERPLTKNVWEAFWIGGAVGGLFGGVAGTARTIDESPRNQFGRLINEQLLQPIEGSVIVGADAAAREGMRPEFAQRAAIPAMLAPQFADAPATGLPAEISTPQPPGSPFAPQPAPPPPFFVPPGVRPAAEPPAETPPVSISSPSTEAANMDTPVRKRRSPAAPVSERPRFRPPGVRPTESQAQPVVVPEPPVVGPRAQPLPTPEAPKVTIDRLKDGIRLAGLQVPESERGKGIGTRIVQDLIAESEATQKPIYLTASTSADQQQRLNSFYERLGFEHWRNDPLSGKPMYRYVPKSSQPPTQPTEVPSALPIRPQVVQEIRQPAEASKAAGQVEPDQKAAEEQLESDAVRRARDLIQQSNNPEQAYDSLVQLYDEMGKLRTRTAASKTAQAYSTPPPLAFLAGRLIGLDTGRIVAEPTAGNGMLLIGAHPSARLIANELDPNRNARLLSNFPRADVSMIDATTQDYFGYLNQWGPDRLIMNPPFGGVFEEGGTTKKRFPLINAATAKSDTPSIDLAIALNSLETMSPDGRAVIIIGSKTGTMGPQFSPNDSTRAKDYQRPEMLEFFQRFNVTDWFTVSGKMYEKMGAGWPVDVIVINGKKATLPSAQGGFARPWVKPPKVYNSWAELKEKLHETPITSSESAAVPPEPTSRPGTPVRRPPGRPTGGAGGPSLRPAGPRGGTGVAGTPGITQEPRTPPAAPSPERLPEPPKPQPKDSGATVVPPSSPEPAPRGPAVLEPTRRGFETGGSGASLGEGSNTLNVPFAPVSILGGSNLVAPRNLADSMARAVRTLERETGQSIDDYVAHKLGWAKKELAERFSAAQAEAVALFIRNLETRGTGLINSDQTGVGKGRSVAAAIQYAIKNGKIPVFITAKKQLYSDMAGRDLPAIGVKTFHPFITDSGALWSNGQGEEVNHKPGAAAQRDTMMEIARTGKLPSGVHGIFTTYDQLKSDKPQGWKEDSKQRMSRKKKFEPRPDGPRFQMLRALAPKAVFILDEAHLSAGQDSDVGLALQSILPNAAGVYYASATFAKRPDNLSLYALGTAMKKAGLKREELAEVFKAGGVPLQQALTSMLAESGEFVRREQNMEGVDFKFESTGTDPEKEAELADTYTSFLRDLFQLSEQVNAAAAAQADSENQVRAEEETVDLSNTNFGARLFNLSSQYLFSLRADATIQKAISALKAGQKPFIAVYNTMAGPIADLQERKLPISFGGMLEREMLKMLEVKIKDPLAPADPAKGLKKGQRLIILTPEELPDGGRFFYQLRDQIRATDFTQMPISPIDTIKAAIKKAGYTIGEITGRKGEVETENEQARVTKRELLDRNRILSDFNNGALDAMIVNGSADTGVSAHADPRFKDQRQRHMIIAQPNPDINGFMQIVGRVMRFGQTKKPVYSIIGTSLATERRFSTMLRAKLNSLNANTTADTESTITQGGLTDDIFNAIGDEVVANVMASNSDLAQLALIDPPNPEEPDSLSDYARYATGRFVLLPNADSENLWREISETYAATIKALDDAGENPLRADVVDLRSKTTKSQVIQEGTGKTLFDGPVVLESADVRPPQPALTSQQALEMAAQGRSTAEQRAEDWLAKYAAARAQRVEAMRQRDVSPEQIDAAIRNFENTKSAVQEAVRLLGETVAVQSTSGEGVDYYAIPIGLMLKSDKIGDFSGASKHSIVLATNSLRRQITIPLSQLARIEQASVESFDSERDQSGVRHIVTGNLLRGVQDASKIARGTARPKVTIYSTSDGQVKTGILMAPGWRPEVGLRALGKVINSSAGMKAALASGKLITAGPVLIRGDSFSVPSRNEFRSIWSDPQFNRLFAQSPIERRGEFRGDLTSQGREALFEFLRSKGLTPTLQAIESEEGGTSKYSVTLKDAPATGVTSADIAAAFPASQGFAVKPVLVQFRNEARETVGFLVRLPNGQAILIDPSHDTIAFDPEKAAADWGITQDQIGVAVGKFTAGGATLDGISRTGLLDLLNTAGPDTLSHEKFHALFEMALTAEERASILGRYKTEEKAAEAFRRSEGFTRGFWDKMRRFLEWLANFVRGDAFKALRRRMSPEFVSQPTGRTEGQYSLEDVFRSKDSLERFIAKPTISPEEAASLRQQAGAQASLVPDPIADEIKGLNPSDPIEQRMAGLLEFVVKLHGMAPALEIQRILADPNLTDDLKDAAISGVLRQIEHVRAKTVEIDDELQKATKKLAERVKSMGKVTEQQLIQERSKQVADNLIAGYRAYLTAQAASLPANQNVAAARQNLIRRMEGALTQTQNFPDATTRALEAIALRIDELPVAEGPQAVIDAIRSKNILRGKVGESTIEMLTEEKPGGLPPLLLNPEINTLLRSLADLQRNAATYAKQIEVVEQAFRGKGEPTPVELRRWAETYRKFRNKQADAAKALAEHAKEFREADQDVQVYGRSHEILTRLQQDPQFQRQFEAAINRPGGEIFKDIFEADEKGERVYTSPLKHQDAEGNEYQNKFRVHLAPDKLADEQTVAEMQQFIAELNEYLSDPALDPRERRTWTLRRDYIQRYGIAPAFSHKTPTLTFDTPYGTIKVNPYSWIAVAFGGRARGPRTELEHMAFRAAREVNTTFRVADQALIGYRLTTNNKVFGDAATKVAILDAVKSHNLPVTRIPYWNEHVLNPILASGQAAGQMRLKAGDYIPGTGIKITRQDMEAARLEKDFSKSIVQTTQGTAKGLPGMLVDNPVLIEDTGGGKKVLRAALGTGPLTMARHYSWWGTQFATAWDAAKTDAARRRLVTDGQNFQHAALGYVTTTNPEFNNASPLLKVYETFAARAKEDENYQVQSFDQLVDRLAEIAVQKKMFPTMTLAEVKAQVETTLLSEIGQHVAAFQAQFAAEKFKGDVPQTVMQFASAASSFTLSRKQMLAPDPYYDYTLTTDSSRIGFVGAAYQQFQLKQITALEALQASLNERLTLLAPEITRLENSGVSPRKARATLNEQTKKHLDRERFPYRRLLDHKRIIDKILKDLDEQVIDIREQNDSAALFALGRLSSTLSSSLLANPTALANNLFGGGIAAQHVVLRNLGRANIIRTPLKSIGYTVDGLVKRILVSYPVSTPIGAMARSNLPLVRQMAKVIDIHVRNAIQQYAEAQAMGLVAPTDMRNRMRAQGELMQSAGHIENEPAPLPAAIPNWMESIPGIRHFFGHLRDLVPRFIDEAVNLGAIGLHRAEVFDSLKNHAEQAFAAREELARRTGRTDLFDFTKEANLLTPKELGMPNATGHRDADSMRQMFEIVGNLDAFLYDYYLRWKAAPESEKADVPLFTNPADEGAVLYDMQAHGNTPTPGFTPPSMAGVGQAGIIKKLIFMFQNYVLRHAAQNERLGDKDLRDPAYWREAYALWGMIAALIIAALAGVLAIETGVPVTRAITGRAPSRVTLANVLNSPDAGMAARYAGMALANTVPYYGQVFSQMLGNPGYGSWWDVANIIPMAGLVKDSSIAMNRMAQTGDAFYPTMDFLGRWFPPASPVLRLFPDIAGDIEGRNAARALRVVAPSEGMELVGSGGTGVQTPATVETRRLLSAAYRGDAEGIRTAFDAAVRARAEAGSPDPEKAVLQSLAAATPARKVLGRSITPAEEARLLARMSDSQRYAYAASADAFNLINQTIGTSYSLTKEPAARRTTGGRKRRSLFAGSRLPSIRRARSRRSPFGRSRSRQVAGRRKRRSPAKLSFSA